LLQSNWLHYKWRALTEVGERIPEKIFDEIKPLWIEAGENIAKASIKYMWALHCLSKAGFGLTKQTEARTDNSSSESPNEDLTFASDYDSSIGYSDSEMEIADPPLPFGIRDLIATTPILKSKRLLILANEDPNTWETDLDDAWEEVQIELYELMSRPEILLLEIEPETAATLSFTGSLAPASGLPIMLRHLASCPTSPLSGICLSAMANIVAAHGSALNPAEKASIIRAADTFIEGLPPDDPRYEGYKQFAQDLIIATEDL